MRKESIKFYYVISAATEDEAQFSFSLISVPEDVKKYIKVSSDGKISVKKGIKTGSYNISVRITAAETDLHTETTMEKDFSVTVKKHIATFPSLKKLGLKKYSSNTNKKLDEAMERMWFVFAAKFIIAVSLIALVILYFTERPLWIAPIIGVFAFVVYRLIWRLICRFIGWAAKQ